MFCTNWSSSISRFPMAKIKHKTFFMRNLMVLCTSLIFSSKLSPWVSREGNLPALLRPGPKKPGNLLDKRLGSQKCIVLLGELLDKFLLLVQLFQVVGTHVGDTRFLSLITMLLITKDADGEFWPWDVAQSTGKIMLKPKNVTTLKLLFT